MAELIEAYAVTRNGKLILIREKKEAMRLAELGSRNFPGITFAVIPVTLDKSALKYEAKHDG